jgi:hypothetical protein
MQGKLDRTVDPPSAPETLPPGLPPDDMNRHLQPTWFRVLNEITDDRTAIDRSLEQIKACKANIKFFKERIVVNKQALTALGQVKEK